MPTANPTSKEALWNALRTKNFESIKACLIANPELINAKKEEGGMTIVMQLLLALSITNKESISDLLTYIVNQKNFNSLSYATSTGNSAVKLIISMTDLTIFNIFNNNCPDIIYSGLKFSYTEADRAVGLFQRSYDREKIKNPNSPETLEALSSLENVTSMRNTLHAKTVARDLRILEAIKSNQITNLVQLEQEGGFKVLLPLMTGQNWQDIAKQESSTEIVVWCTKAASRQADAISLAAFIKTREDLAKKQAQAVQELGKLSLGCQEDVQKASNAFYANTEEAVRGMSAGL